MRKALVLLIATLAFLLFFCMWYEADKGIIGSAEGPTLIYVST